MLRPGRATWSGKHSSVEDVIAEPKGLQQPRIEELQEIADLGLTKVFSLFLEAPDSDEPLINFAEDCRAAGLDLRG